MKTKLLAETSGVRLKHELLAEDRLYGSAPLVLQLCPQAVCERQPRAGNLFQRRQEDLLPHAPGLQALPGQRKRLQQAVDPQNVSIRSMPPAPSWGTAQALAAGCSPARVSMQILQSVVTQSAAFRHACSR